MEVKKSVLTMSMREAWLGVRMGDKLLLTMSLRREARVGG